MNFGSQKIAKTPAHSVYVFYMFGHSVKPTVNFGYIFDNIKISVYDDGVNQRIYVFESIHYQSFGFGVLLHDELLQSFGRLMCPTQ